MGAEQDHRMKQAENNEIDSLLRAFAQRERAAANVRSVQQPAGGDLRARTSIHLDADELSAYAENALPVATRTRYTAHLADCDDCRKIVAQLAATVGLPGKERGAELGAVTWREKCAALFSPRVLRYAMPAFVVLAVIAVGFFALRQKKEASLVAQNQGSENSRGAITQVETKQPETSVSEGGPKAAGNQEQTRSQKHSQATPETKSGTNDKAETATVTAAGAPPTAAPAKDKDSSKKETAAASRPSYAPEPPPSPKPTAETANAEKPAQVAEESRESEEAAARRKEADRKSASRGAFANAPASPGTASAQPSARKAGAVSAGATVSVAGATGQRSDNEAETRTVSGRRFRRQSGAWVDTAYDSSQSTTNVGRGSEQYRALIADEPAIRTIAEQLSGQVIVVWKGRAYRIH